MTAEMNADGKLEIKLRDPKTKAVTTKVIYGTRIVSNGRIYWEYVQNNGRRLVKESKLNPKLMALALGKKYFDRGEEGQICWQYKSQNHTQNEKMVPKEILGSV